MFSLTSCCRCWQLQLLPLSNPDPDPSPLRDFIHLCRAAVTGQHAEEEEIEKMIETGESEMIFQKAILEQGRGYVMDTLAEIRERRDAGEAGRWA